MKVTDDNGCDNSEISATVCLAVQELFSDGAQIEMEKSMSFSELGMDEVDTALFLLRLEELYHIRFSSFLPLYSLGDVCAQVEFCINSRCGTIEKHIRRKEKSNRFRK